MWICSAAPLTGPGYFLLSPPALCRSLEARSRRWSTVNGSLTEMIIDQKCQRELLINEFSELYSGHHTHHATRSFRVITIVYIALYDSHIQIYVHLVSPNSATDRPAECHLNYSNTVSNYVVKPIINYYGCP